MSKIGELNLVLQEQANELGFSTVQQARDAGYKVIFTGGSAKLALDLSEEIEAAHEQYENRKQLIISKLEMLISDTPYKVYKDTLREAIDFIKEKEV